MELNGGSWDRRISGLNVATKKPDSYQSLSPDDEFRLQEILRFIEGAFRKAIDKHPQGFHGPHEALGVVMEEFDEFKTEVYAQTFSARKGLKEAAHLAAMAVRTIFDLDLLNQAQIDEDNQSV